MWWVIEIRSPQSFLVVNKVTSHSGRQEEIFFERNFGILAVRLRLDRSMTANPNIFTRVFVRIRENEKFMCRRYELFFSRITDFQTIARLILARTRSVSDLLFYWLLMWLFLLLLYCWCNVIVFVHFFKIIHDERHSKMTATILCPYLVLIVNTRNLF